MHNDANILRMEQAIEHCEKMAKTLDCKDCAEDHRQLAEWLKELRVYKKFEECGYEMPKPKRLLRLETRYKGFGYACPYCGRGVIRVKGLQQCKVCGGMVDNDNIELASGKMKLKADAKGSWR